MRPFPGVSLAYAALPVAGVTAMLCLEKAGAFRHDLRLLLQRPFAPPAGASENLEPPHRLQIAGLKRKL